VALNPIQPIAEVKKGGGLFGKVAGTVIGGVAGAVGGTFAGNPVGGAMLGASLGGAAGGMIGNAVNPGKVIEGNNVSLSAMEQKPTVQLAQLVDSQKALMDDPRFSLPEKEELNQTTFAPTIAKLKQHIGAK
jgi:hypothetical protein